MLYYGMIAIKIY